MKLILVALTFLHLAFAQTPAQQGPYDLSLAKLQQANIDPRDSEKLIEALRTGERLLRIAAADALGYLPSTPQTVAALEGALVSDDDLLLVYAGNSLNRISVKTWPKLVVGRVTAMKDRNVQISFAKSLAQAGCYEAWPVVRSALLDPNISRIGFIDAALVAGAFRDMDGPFGKRSTLAKELHDLLPLIPQERQKYIWTEIDRVQSSGKWDPSKKAEEGEKK